MRHFQWNGGNINYQYFVINLNQQINILACAACNTKLIYLKKKYSLLFILSVPYIFGILFILNCILLLIYKLKYMI